MEQSFSAATRRDDLATMARETFDVLVVGGGITGAGVARDAAMRGLRTALIDTGDFARGTSSQSSRLIHGGLRYLEHGWLKLVFEASRERRTLLRLAPHLVRSREFLFPSFRGARVARWQISAAVLLYDALALFRNAGRHRWLSRSGVLRAEPLLRDQDLTGGASYWDAQCDDARLTIATARSARQHGARCASYARLTTLEKAGGRIRGALVDDVLTGVRLAIRAHVVVNATGPWSDAVRRLDDPAARSRLRTTKGVHIAVDRERVGNEGAITLTSPLDGRVFFVLPLGTTTVAGTTDTDSSETPDAVAPSPDDVRYLLRSVNAAFPNARLQVEDVIAAWAGLRPLLDFGDRDAGSVPREHAIEESAGGMVSIMGGKLTTYRAMAAEVVDRVMQRLMHDGGASRPAAPTDELPLPGGEVADLAILAEEMTKDGVPGATARHLAGMYGTDAEGILALIQQRPELGRPLLPRYPWLAAEVVHHARRELALSVSDIMLRRLHVFHQVRGHGLDCAAGVAELLAAELGWSADDAAASVTAYGAECARLDAGLRPVS